MENDSSNLTGGLEIDQRYAEPHLLLWAAHYIHANTITDNHFIISRHWADLCPILFVGGIILLGASDAFLLSGFHRGSKGRIRLSRYPLFTGKGDLNKAAHAASYFNVTLKSFAVMLF